MDWAKYDFFNKGEASSSETGCCYAYMSKCVREGARVCGAKLPDGALAGISGQCIRLSSCLCTDVCPG